MRKESVLLASASGISLVQERLDLDSGDWVTWLDPAPVMKKQAISPFFLRSTLFALVLGATAGFILVSSRAGLGFPDSEAFSNVPPRTLSFQERVAYQRAIEEVYWRHRIWPKENPGPKPSLDAVMSQAQIESKVADYLRKSQALEDYWQRPITARQLQAEMDRMARNTRQPDVLRELFEALGNDPFVIAECLARPALVNRLITNWYAFDERIHGALKQRAETELRAHPTVAQMKQLGGSYAETELVKGDRHGHETIRGPGRHVRLGARDWHRTVERLARLFSRNSAAAGVPSRRAMQKKEALGIAEIPAGVPSPLQEDETCYYATAILKVTNERLKLATVSWPKEPLESWLSRAEDRAPTSMVAAGGGYRLPELPEGASCVENTWSATAAPPDARSGHTAVWTGSEMIIWGGQSNSASLDTGGRYDPATDTWTPTNSAGAPAPRSAHTAIWTGTEMIVWGGVDQNSSRVNTGGKYNPGADSWSPTSTSNAPDGRQGHTTVWTGSQMIVWGGLGNFFNDLNTGGKYDPASNSWTATATTGAPSPRQLHAAVWTGSEMIVWGGRDDSNFVDLNTGGRYNPNTNSWKATTTSNAPDTREKHTAVWTGSEMIIWGGFDQVSFADLNSGGKYDPLTDSWTPTSNIAPDPRELHTAVWTGSEMIVWGGTNQFFQQFNTGGRYDPSTDSWTATSTVNAPDARSSHTAVWTDTEMIVWGGLSGFPFGTAQDTGGRYDPDADTWTPTNTYNVPEPRSAHTAVWTGSEMIVWGGNGQNFFSSTLNTGGKYDLATDSWTPTTLTNAPSPRSGHNAVWTGTQMIVWGGTDDNSNYLNSGARYNPGADAWAATTSIAPLPRSLHTAVWTGREMIIWGGTSDFGFLNTGAAYNPATDIWRAINPNAPDPRIHHTAVWAGSQMIVWGGEDFNGNTFNAGGRYDPSSDSWSSTSTINAPSARTLHTAVWTSSEMIIWGGRDQNFNFPDVGGRYNPVTDSWTATSNIAPDGRELHTAVWTGTQMIIWGGETFSTPTNSGGQYVPDTDTWIATNAENAPSARDFHTAVWTGSDTGSAMIVWGGNAGNGLTNTGGIYCAQGAPIPTPTPSPTPTARPSPTPRERPSPHPRPTP